MREPRTVDLLTGAVTGSDLARIIESPTVHTRLHFNWGYHEAAQDRLHQRPKRTEFSGCGKTLEAVTAYAAGHEYGWLDAVNGVYANNSEEAWQAHTAQPVNN
jgi:hypothetical protein